MLTLIYGVGIASHIMLDGMTSFGTRMWYPISQRRVAWDWVFIIDFTFTSIILLPQVIAWIYRDTQQAAKKSRAALCACGCCSRWARLIAWVLAYEVGFRFTCGSSDLRALLFAALFFLPRAAAGDFE